MKRFLALVLASTFALACASRSATQPLGDLILRIVPPDEGLTVGGPSDLEYVLRNEGDVRIEGLFPLESQRIGGATSWCGAGGTGGGSGLSDVAVLCEAAGGGCKNETSSGNEETQSAREPLCNRHHALSYRRISQRASHAPRWRQMGYASVIAWRTGSNPAGTIESTIPIGRTESAQKRT